MVYKYMLIFLGAAIPWIEVLAVVPLGIIWGLSPVGVMIIAFIGNMITVIPVVIGFEKVKVWYARRQKKKGATSKSSRRGVKLFKKYGVIGLAFLGPILLGTHVASLIGMTMGANRQGMLIWMTISIASWIIAVGTLTAFGFDLFLN